MERLKIDWLLLLPAAFLSLIGLFLISGVAPEQLQGQALFIVLSVVVVIVVSKFGYDLLSLFSPYEYVASLIFLLTPFVFGQISRGATRWLQLGSFSLQPSELVKPFLILFFARIAANFPMPRWLWLLLTGGMPILIIFLQPDLGTALVLTSGWLTIFLSQLQSRTILALGLGFLALLPITYQFVLQPYQRDRLITFVDPYHDPLGKGYHVIQSVIAVGSGGLFGKGLGHGTQSQLRFLPEHHTDFIFASLSESFGFLGSFVVILLYIIWLWRIYRISQSTTEKSEAIFTTAVAAMMAFQIFVNIGMNIGVAPVTGVTLPFLSSGGSSLLSLAITIGLLNSISSSRRHRLGL